ncbi:SulP family inorganic anion transporter [Labrenzia aggregata]|uniref:SulP family inorganic anion transporter n=2 Tax=Roseibium aggregatum TaxID=187304 RepID=A0A926NZI4_9HYPH|nr:SulP family inorganic anion transporter [Roseibium aggregatum]
MSGMKPKRRLLAGVLPVRKDRILSETIAGLTLAAVAIPEVMGYTKIAGTPVITGLYTMLLPMALFALFGSSRHLVVGADSATAAILATSLAGLAAAGSANYVALAGLIALLVGLLLVVASVARLGFMADFLSRTVLVGFLSGVGIQVAMNSLPGMLGIKIAQASGLAKLSLLLPLLPSVSLPAAAISLSALLLILGFRGLSRSFPGAIVALGLITLVSWIFDFKSAIDVVGSVPGGLPQLALPNVDWSFALIWQLGPVALAMLVVILAQSAATARAYATKYNETLNDGMDLRALGFANLGAGLTGTFVVNGSPTKSRIVESAGGRTQLSMLISVGIVILVLLFFTHILAYLPEAALSALVFLIGIDLIDLKGLQEIHRTRRAEFWVSAVTILVVVVAGVGPGILLAIVLSLIVHTRHGYHPVNVLLTPETAETWQVQPLKTRVMAAPGLMVYRFTHAMYYANAGLMAAEIKDLVTPAAEGLRYFCIDFSCVDDIDFTALKTLKKIQAELAGDGIELLFAHTLDDPAARSRLQLVKTFGESIVFSTVGEVLSHIRTRKPPPLATSAS